MGKMDGKRFLAVDKKWLGTGLDSLELLILAQIDEFQRQKWPCHVTDKQLAVQFGESERTVSRRLDKLEEKGMIIRDTRGIQGNGGMYRRRTLQIVDVQPENKEEGNICDRQNGGVIQTKLQDDTDKSEKCSRQNGVIKESLKENEKNFLKNKNEDAYAQKKKTKGRRIEELSFDEGNRISKLLRENKARYQDIQREYGLEYGSVTKEFTKKWESEKRRRASKIEAEQERERRARKPKCDYRFYPRVEPDPEQVAHERMMDEMILEMLAEDDEDEEEEKKYCTDPEKVAESLRTLQKVKEELERKRWGEDDD